MVFIFLIGLLFLLTLLFFLVFSVVAFPNRDYPLDRGTQVRMVQSAIFAGIPSSHQDGFQRHKRLWVHSDGAGDDVIIILPRSGGFA